MAEKERIECPICEKNFLGKKCNHQITDVLKRMSTLLKIQQKIREIDGLLIDKYVNFIDQSMDHIGVANGEVPGAIADAIRSQRNHEQLDPNEPDY